TFTAKAKDAAGNTGSASTGLTVTIDTAAPNAPTISSITPDTGTSSSDHITSATTLTLSGTAEGSSTVSVFDGSALLGTTVAAGGGAWTFSTTVAGNTTHDFTAKATDVAGNTGSASADFFVTVDNSLPGAPTIAAFTPDTGSSASDGLTSATTLTLSGTAEP